MISTIEDKGRELNMASPKTSDQIVIMLEDNEEQDEIHAAILEMAELKNHF